MFLKPQKKRTKVQGWKVFEEIIAGNLANLAKNINIQIQESA